MILYVGAFEIKCLLLPLVQLEYIRVDGCMPRRLKEDGGEVLF